MVRSYGGQHPICTKLGALVLKKKQWAKTFQVGGKDGQGAEDPNSTSIITIPNFGVEDFEELIFYKNNSLFNTILFNSFFQYQFT